MEHLRVENFLVIKKAELNVNKICVIIGPQASGKSVLAKLLHLFREFFESSTRKVLLDSKGEHVADFEKTACGVLKKLFSTYFPGILKKGLAFHIQYVAAEFSVEITGSEKNRDYRKFKVSFSDTYLKFLTQIGREFTSLKRSFQSKDRDALHDTNDPLAELLWKSLAAEPFRRARRYSVFVPASRAYFASLRKHIFSLLQAGVSLDPLMVEFGAKYENSKKDNERYADGLLDKAGPLVQSILVGKYLFHEGDDCILSTDGIVKLQHASSGQQEALPMLVVLTDWENAMPVSSGFIVEEPEAHLYPKAQRDIVSLFGLLRNQRQLDFFITTHSPYILAALNNLILAGEVKNTVGADALRTVVDPNFTLNFSDVSAYTLTDGILHSILDEEEKLIGINAIDCVSDEFGREFEELLELRAMGERGAYSG